MKKYKILPHAFLSENKLQNLYKQTLNLCFAMTHTVGSLPWTFTL